MSIYILCFDYTVSHVHMKGVSQKRPPKIFGYISQSPNGICKIVFTSLNLCSFIILPKGN